MHDFDYDAMQKKRIARGAMHMKRGSKSRKVNLPSDGLTPAQLRRLNGPVSTYKMDEPMSWESFKAMPEDLQKKYIIGLQDTYKANDSMLGKMFGKSHVTMCELRKKLDVGSLGKATMSRKAADIRDAKWDAFCNGVIGGKPGEVSENCGEPVANVDEFTCETMDDDPKMSAADWDGDCKIDIPEEEKVAPTLSRQEFDKIFQHKVAHAEVIRPTKIDVEYVCDISDPNVLMQLLGNQCLPDGKCRIKIEIERF